MQHQDKWALLYVPQNLIFDDRFDTFAEAELKLEAEAPEKYHSGDLAIIHASEIL